MFDHEKLDAYRTARSFLTLTQSAVGQAPRGKGFIVDQLHRAALSIVTNVAEGAGEFAPAEKARFYRIAARSVAECAALFDVCRELDMIEPNVANDGRELLLRLIALLTGLARRHQRT